MGGLVTGSGNTRAPYVRKEVIGDCTLYLGDCLEVMPKEAAVDAVVTDPVWPNVPADSVPVWEDPWGLWADACRCMPPHQRIIVVMRCDSDPRFLGSVDGPFLRSIQLPYVMPGYLGRVLGGDETAYWFGTPIKRAPGRMVIPGRAPAVQPHGRKPNGHPMSRAQRHFDWLLDWCTDEGETALDPFMGSGTTGVACARLGRRFIGIEIDPGYFDLACRRVEEAYRQADLFISAPPKPAQQLLDGAAIGARTNA